MSLDTSIFSPSLFISASFFVTFSFGNILINFLVVFISLKKSCIFLASDGSSIPFLPSFKSCLDNGLPVLTSTILVEVVIFAFGLDILLAGILNILLPTSPTLLSITCL